MSEDIYLIKKLVEAGRIKEAMPAVNQLLSQDPKNKFLLTVSAHNNFCEENFDQAFELLRLITDIDAEDIYANRHIAIIQYIRGEYAESIATYLNLFGFVGEYNDQDFDLLITGIAVSFSNKSLGAKIIEWVFAHSPYLKNSYLDNSAPNFLVDISIKANSVARDERYRTQHLAVQKLFNKEFAKEKSRFDDFLENFHGIKRLMPNHRLQKPSYHLYPGLRTQPFYDPTEFPELVDFKDFLNDISEEVLLLYSTKQGVTPYIHEARTGNNGLDILANSYQWSAIHLFKGGKPVESALLSCPTTSDWLKRLPLPKMEGHSPEAFLSILKPNTEIKPHFGLSNLKLTLHLAINIPELCSITVGTETRSWTQGELLIFDDSFIHEAENKSKENRVVFITEIWHPDLTLPERKALELVMKLQVKVFENIKDVSFEHLVAEIKLNRNSIN